MHVSGSFPLFSNNAQFDHEGPFASLLSEYELYYSKPDLDFSKVKTYFHGHKHSCAQCISLSSQVIISVKKYTHLTPAVVLEGWSANTVVSEECASLAKTDFMLEELEEIDFFGWDASKEVLDELGLDKQSAMLILDFIKNHKLAIIDARAARYALKKDFNERFNFQDETLFSMEISDLEALKQSMENAKEPINSLSKQIEGHKKIIQELKMKLDRDIQEKESGKDAVRTTFPVRTQAMVQTLRVIKKLRAGNILEGAAHVLCGAEHVKTARKNAEIAEFQLDALYEELKEHDAVVLIHKACADF